GGVAVEEDGGPRALRTGERFAFERFVTTAEDGRAFVALPGDVELRIAERSRVLVLGRRAVELAGGRLFVLVPPSSGAVSVATIAGELVTEEGAVQLTAKGGWTEIVTLDGEAVFVDATGGSATLGPGRRVVCDDG